MEPHFRNKTLFLNYLKICMSSFLFSQNRTTTLASWTRNIPNSDKWSAESSTTDNCRLAGKRFCPAGRTTRTTAAHTRAWATSAIPARSGSAFTPAPSATFAWEEFSTFTVRPAALSCQLWRKTFYDKTSNQLGTLIILEKTNCRYGLHNSEFFFFHFCKCFMKNRFQLKKWSCKGL